MKVLGRILIILATVLLVVGATYAVVQATGGGTGRFGRGDGGRFLGGNPPDGGNRPFGSNGPRGDFGGDGGRRGGGSGFFEILRNVFIVGVIFLVVMSASLVLDGLRKAPPDDPLAEPK